MSKKDEVHRELSLRIQNGVYAPGNFLPPERVLAEEFKISRPTLRKALDPLVDAGLLVIHPGVGTRVAIPGQDERALPKSRQIIGLLQPDITDQYYSELTKSIEYCALHRGYHLLLCNSWHQLAQEELHIQHLANRPVSGVILAHDPQLHLPAAVSMLDDSRIPYVVLFSSPAEVACDSVMVDDRAGVDQIMRYLLSLGHRHVAFCRALPGESPHPRELEYHRFMAANELPVPHHFVMPYESLTDAARRASLESLFRQSPRPTAIFCCNDRVAMVVMKHLFDLGIKVPQEVSIVGFDNLRFTEHLPVPLTTVDQPTQEMGRRAVELLLERIEAGRTRPPRREVFHPHLIIRDSCAIASAFQNLEVSPVA